VNTEGEKQADQIGGGGKKWKLVDLKEGFCELLLMEAKKIIGGWTGCSEGRKSQLYLHKMGNICRDMTAEGSKN